MRVLLLVSLLAACRPHAATPSTPTPLLASDAEPLYRPTAEPVRHDVCAPRAPAPTYRKRKVYEFYDEEITPDALGPRTREMSLDPPRSQAGIARRIRGQEAKLKQCYRWARHKREDLEGTFLVHMEIDELGVPAVSVDADNRSLVTCAREVLGALRWRPFVSRRTEVTFPMRFERSGHKRPRKRPSYPTVNAPPPPPAGCVAVPEPGIVDRVVFESPVVEVTDFDGVQNAHETWEGACQEALRKHQQCPTRVLIDYVGTPGVHGEIDKMIVREAIRSNRGAFGACYAEALGRIPSLVGERAVVAFSFSADGRAHDAQVRVATNDTAFVGCLRAAVEELRLPVLDDWIEIQVTIPFALGPPRATAPTLPSRASIAAIEQNALDMLQAGDAETALRRYSALITQAPDHPHLCAWRVGALRAVLAQAPWVDERVVAAATDLAAQLQAHPEPECLSQAAADALASIAEHPHQLGTQLLLEEQLELAVERYRLLLRVPGMTNDTRLRKQLVDALTQLGRDAEAKEAAKPPPVVPEPVVEDLPPG